MPPVSQDLNERSLLYRDNHDLKLCSNYISLSLEDDAPAKRPRAIMLSDLADPCWIWEKADLSRVKALEAGVGQLPFNFSIGKDRDKIELRPSHTPEGELEVHLNSCDGPKLATLPLKPAVQNDAVTTLSAPLAGQTGIHDLCFVFARPKIDPIWALDWVQLEPRATH